jgi:hypothetical protein
MGGLGTQPSWTEMDNCSITVALLMFSSSLNALYIGEFSIVSKPYEVYTGFQSPLRDQTKPERLDKFLKVTQL